MICAARPNHPSDYLCVWPILKHHFAPAAFVVDAFYILTPVRICVFSNGARLDQCSFVGYHWLILTVTR
jgi:hypothetical protein